MAKALLVQLNKELCDILTLNLPLYLGFETLKQNNVDDAIELLNLFTDIEVIIAPNKSEGENIAQALHNHLEHSDKDIPLLIFGEVKSLKEHYVMIKDEMDWREAIHHCGEILGTTSDALDKLGRLNLSPVPIHHFHRIDKPLCDVFLKIPNSSKKEGYKFIKRIPEDEVVEKKLLLKWENFNIENLYIPKNKREEFGEYIANSILGDLDRDDVSFAERMKIQSEAYSFIQDEIEDLGISPKVVEAATKTIDSMKVTVQSNETLTALLDQIKKNKSSYIYKHALLISFIANKVLQKVEWGTENQVRKMIFVAFFHDICLPNDEFCQIETEEELKKSKLPPADKLIIREHAYKASRMIRSFPEAPLDAATIILHHHGSINGKGFVEYITNKIVPLGIIFILCEEYVNMLIKNKNFSQKNAIAALQEKYSRGSFKKAMEAIGHLELE